MKMRALHLIGTAFFVFSMAGADWPQWRGPDRTSVSQEKGLLKSWPKKGPELLWTYEETGLGYSGPAIVGDRLYIMGARGQSEYAIALETKNARQIWATEIGPTFHFQGNSWGDGPRSTPTVDGEHIYALGGQGELVCLETATGKKLWQHNLFKEFDGYVMDNNGPERTGWGYAEGPLVDGDHVVCTPGGKDGALLAFNKLTGQVAWRSKQLQDKAPYSSMIVVDVGGIRQYVQLTDKGVVGVAANDGHLVWSFKKDNDDLVVRTPIFHNSCVFATYSFGAGSQLIKLVPSGSAIKAEKLYSNKNMKNELGGVVLVGENLYGFSDNKGWVCQGFKKGDIAWSSKKLEKGSVVSADGNLYCYTEAEGTAALVEANPTRWREKGRFTIPRQTTHRPTSGKIWTHPVVANGKLYLRDQDLLFCYDIKDASKSEQ